MAFRKIKYHFFLFPFVFLGNHFFSQHTLKIDSIISSWEKNGVPPGKEKAYKEYLDSKEKIAAAKIAAAKVQPGGNLKIQGNELDPCFNPGLELATFAQWGRYTGTTGNAGSSVPTTSYGIVDYSATGNVAYNVSPQSNDLFVLHNSATVSSTNPWGYDAYSLSGGNYYLENNCPFGGAYSARINNDAGGEKAAKLDYYFTVTPGTTSFDFRYAVVMSDGGHDDGEQAAFTINITEYSTGIPLPVANTTYTVNANDCQTAPGFYASDASGGNDVYFKDWTSYSINLCPFQGKNIKVEFQAIDCIYGAHFCYAYIDLACGPEILAAQNGNCANPGGFNLQVTPGAGTYQWQDPQGNNISAAQTGNSSTLDLNSYINNCPGGNCSVNDGDVFNVQVITVAGCTLNIPVVVDLNNVEISSISISPTCAEAASGSIAVVASGGIGSYNYSWYANNCSGSSIGSSSSLSGLYPGNYCINITSGSCPPRDTILTIPVLPMDVMYYTLNVNCLDSNYAIQASAGGTSYNWYQSGALIAGAQSDSLNVLYPAYALPHAVTYINSFDGCKDSANYVLTLNEVSISSFSVTPTCLEASNGNANVIVSGGAGPGSYTYTWYANNCNGSSISNSNPLAGVAPGSYCVHVASGICPAADTMVLIPLVPMDVITTNMNLDCMDSAYVISPSISGTNYSWYQSGNLVSGAQGSSFSINPTNYTIPYAVTYLAQNDGCKDSVNFLFNFKADDFKFYAEYCPNDTAALVFFPGGSTYSNYQWYFNGTPLPSAVGGNNDSVFYLVNVNTLGNYTVVFYSGTCKKMASPVLQVFPADIFVPDTTTNIFSPNGDGINDEFSPYLNKIYSSQNIKDEAENYELSIFNRWGNLVYKTNNYFSFWNGKNPAGLAEIDGTYYWIATFKSNCTNSQEKIVKRGFVQLIR